MWPHVSCDKVLSAIIGVQVPGMCVMRIVIGCYKRSGRDKDNIVFQQNYCSNRTQK